MDANRLASFLFEIGMLRRTPRSGWQFLGSGGENVAEHSFSAAFAGYTLGVMAGADACRVAMLCLVHDVHEARTGDLNYVNRAYVRADKNAAMTDALRDTGLEPGLMPLWEELEARTTLEARLAHDADQLDLMLRLKEQLDLGNDYAARWLQAAEKRLTTEPAKTLARAILSTDHAAWWREATDPSGPDGKKEE